MRIARSSCTATRLRATARRAAAHRTSACGNDRRAFTLIETITALTLTAIVISIAAAAIGAASDARASVRQHQETLEAETRWRALVIDMLRHAPGADAVDEPLLRIGALPDGNPYVTFLSTGVLQPFGTGRFWRVTLGGSAAGVSLDAEPIGRGPQATTLHTTLSHLRLRDISARDEYAGDGWRRDWPVERSRPTLLRLGFADARGAPVAPLIVTLSPLESAVR